MSTELGHGEAEEEAVVQPVVEEEEGAGRDRAVSAVMELSRWPWLRRPFSRAERVRERGPRERAKARGKREWHSASPKS
jgi:hypothetical protein